MPNPYETLPPEAFWRSAVADKSMYEIDRLWSPKLRIGPVRRIATFGSCFAQHFGRALRERGFTWMDTEAPPYGLNDEDIAEFNYNVFSCRTGNIYTTSLLLQWVSWALGTSAPPEEYWTANDRFVDPFRPAIEPGGFASVEEMVRSREETIAAFRKCIEEANIFVFTLGLTESWVNAEGAWEYPMCPGTVAGEFDKDVHRFENQDFGRVQNNLMAAIEAMRAANPRLKFLLTVSPVPLTARDRANMSSSPPCIRNRYCAR